MSFFNKNFPLGSQMDDILHYQTVYAVANVYTIDLANKPVKNIKITTADATAKTVAVSNLPTSCELLIELTYTNAAAITWFSGITWLNGIPTFTAGKVYRIVLFYNGTSWQGVCVGGW